MSRVQLFFAAVLVGLYCATVYAAIRNPELIGLATVVTPVVLLPVGYIFAAGITSQLRKSVERGEDRERREP